LVQFALIWHLTVTTGSATVLATAVLVGMLPNVLLGPLVGALVDRWDRRRIMLIADGSIALATLIMALLFALDAAATWHIYAVMFIRSLASAFHGNAMIASTSLMAPVEHLARIQGINEMLNGGLHVIAAPLSALLLEVLPLQGFLAIDVVTALFAIAPLLLIRIPQPGRTTHNQAQHEAQPTLWQDVKAGVRYLLGWPGLLIISLMTVGINFVLMPAFSLLPLLIKDHFGGGAMRIGIVAGGVLLGLWGGFERRIVTSMLGLMGMGAGALILALAPPWAMSLAVGGAFFFGMMNPMTMGPFFAVIQSTVEPEMQARIFSLLRSVGTGMAPLGLLIAGPVADLVGIQAWFLLGGSICVMMAISGLLIPAVVNIEMKRNALAALDVAA
jgi:MFS transporter, DHA3 family, macrolide efflux protein